jgi:hypothetical protein
VEPHLEQAAARIAAVVEAERPTTHSTLKGLIHEDVNKTTEELYSRIQSLEAKLGKTKNALKRKAVSSGDAATHQKKMAKNVVGNGAKSNKTSRAVVAHSNTIPCKHTYKNKTWKKKAAKPTTKPTLKPPTTKPTKKPPTTPAGNDNAFTTAYNKPKPKATGHKLGGKGGKKPTAKSN